MDSLCEKLITAKHRSVSKCTALAAAMLADAELRASVCRRLDQEKMLQLKSALLTSMAKEHQKVNTAPDGVEGKVYKNQDAQAQIELFLQAGAADRRNLDALKGITQIAKVFENAGSYTLAANLNEKVLSIFEFTSEPSDVLLRGNIVSVLSNCLLKQGELEKALQTFEEYFAACSKGPTRFDNIPSIIAGRYLLNLNLSSERGRDFVSQAHIEWGQAQRRALGPAEKCIADDLDASRPLKIGYLSADFFEHVVGDIFIAVLRGHRATRAANASQFHITCFQLNSKADSFTETMKSLCDKWVEVHDFESAPQVAKTIKRQKIDILIDLGGHTCSLQEAKFSNLDIMALSPAPITCTWMGYPNTTGVDNMTYRITDAVCDPIESTQKYSEQLIRLPTFFSSVAKTKVLLVDEHKEPPCVTAGKVTFGSMNSIRKCSAKTKRAWGKLLMALPESELYIKDRCFVNTDERERWLSQFLEGAIDRSWPGVNFKTFAKIKKRIRLEAFAKDHAEHLKKYNGIDIMLDSWPYAGTSTTAEAMMMGVPCITMQAPGAEGCHSHNVGASMMTVCGLRDLVASTEDEFVQKAIGLARDTARLSEIRASLRDKCLETWGAPTQQLLCSELEIEFRNMWVRYVSDAK